jgi:hypothetical protein
MSAYTAFTIFWKKEAIGCNLTKQKSQYMLQLTTHISAEVPQR